MIDKKLTLLCIVSAFALAACGPSAPEAPAEPAASEAPPAPAPEPAAPAEPATPDLATVLASDARPEADRARDGGRKPADVLAILGVEPGMNVIDLIAAGGWYSHVLSLAVGPEGSVTGQNPAWMHAFRDGAITAGLAARGLSNVTTLDVEWTELAMMEPQFDVALSALNIHDVYYIEGAEGAAQFAAAVYAVLKPGGVLGVIEHVGNPDGDNEALHRLDRALAIEILTGAGFVLEDDSDLLANPDDDHTQGVFSEGLRGNTDRFLLKLRKPAA
jgi:predicted methyltransferase